MATWSSEVSKLPGQQLMPLLQLAREADALATAALRLRLMKAEAAVETDQRAPRQYLRDAHPKQEREIQVLLDAVVPARVPQARQAPRYRSVPSRTPALPVRAAERLGPQ